MTDILLLAVGWGLVGTCVAWIFGEASGGDVTAESSPDRHGLVLLHGGAYDNPDTGRKPRSSAGARRISELQLIVTAARQTNPDLTSLQVGAPTILQDGWPQTASSAPRGWLRSLRLWWLSYFA